MFTRNTLKPLSLALLVAIGGIAHAAPQPTLQQQVTVEPGQRISPRDEAVLSSAAIKVLGHIAAARSALRSDEPDKTTAQENLDQAGKLLEIIQAGLPSTKIKDSISLPSKQLKYQDTREVSPDLIPIYASLDERVDYVASGDAETQVDKAKQAVKSGDKGQVNPHLKASDDALVYVEADLPLNSTRQLVEQAKSQLGEGKTQEAGQTLAVAQDNVVFVSLSYQSPLTHAKAALWRAWQDIKQGQPELAKADLDQAVGYLQESAKSDDPVVREAASDLVSQVRDLHAGIEKQNQDFSDRMGGTWQRLVALSERSSEFISTGWRRLHAEDAAKRDLIDAKLQLAYGRIDHFQAKDDDAAKVDLSEALSYLRSATDKIGADHKDQLKASSDQVAALNQLVTGGKPADAEAFQQAEADLAKLIRQL